MSALLENLDGHIWLDGQLTGWSEAQTHVLSHALHYASSVFEGQRIYAGRVYALEAHIERLAHSAGLMGFALPYSKAELIDACRAVVDTNAIEEGYMRPVAWRGMRTMGVSARGAPVSVAIAAWPWPSYFAPGTEAGVRLTIGAWRRPDPRTAPVHAKAAGVYMIGTLAKEQAEDAGFDDALLLDWRGQVSEATGANVFFVEGDTLHTPIADYFLDGITRRTVMALAKARGWRCSERIIEVDELAGFDGCFLTGSAAEIVPVIAVDQYHYARHPITNTLIEDYARHVRDPNAEVPTLRLGGVAPAGASSTPEPALSAARAVA